jgi:Flp pilus assembly protein TadG
MAMCQILGKLSTTKGKWKDDRGATIVEFAIVLPVLLLLIFGIIDYGLLIYNKQILTNACREGARAGVQQAAPPGVTQSPNRYTIGQIQTEVTNYCSANLVTFGAVNLTFPIAGSGSGYVDSCLSSSQKLKVKVNYVYKFLVLPNIIIGLFNGSMNDTITLTADTIMTCE